MPLSAEAQREEKMIAKQAAVDEKVRDQSLISHRGTFSSLCIIESQARDERREPCGEGRGKPRKGL